MAEVQKLIMDTNVEGFGNSDGKSRNVWVRVPFPQEIIDLINKNCKVNAFQRMMKSFSKDTKTKKMCVWTAYDDVLYAGDKPIKYSYISKDLEDKIGEDAYLKLAGSMSLPQYISGTFKTCWDPYAAVAENAGMRIAMALDMPTSYNYIVKFDPKEYPEVVGNYPIGTKVDKVEPVGIVSIDMLQKDERLVSFESAVENNISYADRVRGDQNLVENWIRAVDKFAMRELRGCPKEVLDKNMSGLHSRIARSMLLREFLGDCDFTAYNGGIVVNNVDQTVRYAPNFDYGECFNALIKKHLMCYGVRKSKFDAMSDKDRSDLIASQTAEDGPIFGMTKEVFNSLPPNVQEQLRKSKGARTVGPVEVSKVVNTWASSSSEQNFEYVVRNFPEACGEFFGKLDEVLSGDKIDGIIDEYTKMTVDGSSLLSHAEAESFKAYLKDRGVWMCEAYVDILNKENSNPYISHSNEM